MKYIYFVTKEETAFDSENKHTTYGIAIKSNGCIILTLSDVSSDREKLQKLCRLCNRLKLDPCQLQEVVEDMLNTPPKTE